MSLIHCDTKERKKEELQVMIIQLVACVCLVVLLACEVLGWL